MKNSKLITYLLCIFTLTSIDAKILEVDQLFNKSLIKVKQTKISTSKSFYGNTKIDEANT